jgi:mannitol/fructose-specific phosphotransferase system IIA component
MVQAMVNISNNANQVLNIVKARFNLKDKSQAIEKVVIEFGKDFLEPELRPEFIQRMKARENEETVKIDDFIVLRIFE